METQVRTPQMVFMQPQRLVVPLFQRPYVWNQERQWEPLWNDVVRVAERRLKNPRDRQQPHFLGAVVLQQSQNPVGLMQQRTIIDGQQRLTTLQLLMDSLHAQLLLVGAVPSAKRIEPLVENAEPFRGNPEDRFKVWPTNRDRAAFNAVMGADGNEPSAIAKFEDERIAGAYKFFSEQAKQWLHAGSEELTKRAEAIESVVREYLQMVVIDLTAEENAQEIFETLNARGAQLTAADLIKNFVFQRLLESGTDVEEAYEEWWKEFESGFWEKEISVGRMLYARSSIFLNHWLIARTGQEVVAREVFDRFKLFADFEAGLPMTAMLQHIHRASRVYRGFVDASTQTSGPVDRLALFAYRTGVLESEAVKPLVLFLLDPEETAIPETQLLKALDVLESWMVRRMLVRATTKSYTTIFAEIIKQIRYADRVDAGDIIESFLAGQKSDSAYWPDDAEIKHEMKALPAYRVLGRGRLRMVLEAVEDHHRGWRDGKRGLGGERVARGGLAIEHIMPQKWATYWPLAADETEEGRDRLIHTLGNLTLLTQKLNTKVSNGPWIGLDGKREALHRHDVLVLNRKILESAMDAWSEGMIRTRTDQVAHAITEIWPVPLGHRSGFTSDKVRIRKRIHLADLINAGLLEAGMRLYPRTKSLSDRVVTLLPDGRIDAEGTICSAPSEAATLLRSQATNGWSFFLVDPVSRRSIRTVRRDYVNELAVDVEEDDDDTDDDDSASSE
jgi:hypothetical protein